MFNLKLIIMQYKPEPLNPPIGYNPIEEYNRQLDKQGEPWIDGGVIDKIVVTPESYQFDWIKKVPAELRTKIYSELTNSNWQKDKNTWSEQYYDFLDRNPEFKNYNKLGNYLYDSNDTNVALNSKNDKYHRLMELWSKYPYKVSYDSTGNKRAFVKFNDKNIDGKYINITNLGDLVAEIVHPYQYDFGKVPKWQFWPQHYERKFREFIFSNSDKRHHHVYETPGYFEHETHKIIEPQLFDYILNETPLKFINQNNK